MSDVIEFARSLNPLMEPNQVLQAVEKYMSGMELAGVKVEFPTDAETMEEIRETAGSSNRVLKLLDLVNNLHIEKLELKQEVELLRIVTTNLGYALVQEEELCNYVIEKTQTTLSRGKIKDMMAIEKAKRSLR